MQYHNVQLHTTTDVYHYYKLTICQSNKRLTTLTPFPIFQKRIPPKRPAAFSVWCKCSYHGLLTVSHTVLLFVWSFTFVWFSHPDPHFGVSPDYLYNSFMVGPVGMFFLPALFIEFCQSMCYDTVYECSFILG